MSRTVFLNVELQVYIYIPPAPPPIHPISEYAPTPTYRVSQKTWELRGNLYILFKVYNQPEVNQKLAVGFIGSCFVS